MYPLLKQHFLINSWVSYFSMAAFIAVAYVIAMPPIFLFVVFILSLLFMLFFYDDKNNVSRFIMSLPVAKKAMIRSRYLFMSIMAVIILLFQWLVMISFPAILDRYIYDWRDLIVVLCMACISIAIFMPIYYAIRSFALATGIIMTLWFLGSIFILTPIIRILGMEEIIIFNDLDSGFALLVEKYIPFQPYVILGVTSLVIFYISMKVSEYLFSKKDNWG